jgi:S1-C subfamily serine protease
MSDPRYPEIQRFEPLPDERHSRRTVLPGSTAAGADQATPERWFEPETASGAPGAENLRPQAGGGRRRGLVAAMLAISLFGAILGAGGTYAALRVSGALDAPTPAPAPTGPRLSIESDTSSVIAAVNRVSPAVVQIVTFDASGNSAVGSGIIYDARGWILTNRHVVEGATTITVRLSDDRRLAGTVYGLDTLTDLAILKINAVADLTVAPIGDSAGIQVGQLAIAIGSPLGLPYPNSVTTGIVSAVQRDISVAADPTSTTSTDLHDLIQTDAAINPGNSGGPLIDGTGHVVGVTTAAAPTAQGIGFAIPVDVAKPIMQQALAGEKLSRPFIGVAYVMIDRGVKDQYSLPLSEGAWVHSEDSTGKSIEAVIAGSPGEKAGVKTGDIITQVESEVIDAAHPLQDVLVQYAPGRTVSVEVYRGGQYITLRVTLGTRPDAAA